MVRDNNLWLRVKVCVWDPTKGLRRAFTSAHSWVTFWSPSQLSSITLDQHPHMRSTQLFFMSLPCDMSMERGAGEGTHGSFDENWHPPRARVFRSDIRRTSRRNRDVYKCFRTFCLVSSDRCNCVCITYLVDHAWDSFVCISLMSESFPDLLNW